MAARGDHESTTIAEDRTAYLADLSGYLWPGASTALERRGQGGDAPVLQDYFVLPDIRGARLLLPTGARAAAATAVRGSSEPRSASARLRRQGVALAVRTGLAERLLARHYRVRDVLPDDLSAHRTAPGDARTIEEHLRPVLGDVVLSLSLAGQARANRKPVLQVLRRDGTTVGFVKVGTNDLTRRLVQVEHDALQSLAAVRDRMPSVAFPVVLHYAQWRGTNVLVQSSLPVWNRRARPDPARVLAASREVAHVFGTRLAPLAKSTYLRDLDSEVDALPPGPEAAVLRQALLHLTSSVESRALLFGSGHGDWTPWNMAQTADRVLVWDWERFSADVPVGFDAVHHVLQKEATQQEADLRLAAESCLGTAAALLEPLGVDPGTAEAVVLLYLVDLSVRYLADSQVRDGAPLADVGRWLLPLVAERTAAAAALGAVTPTAP